MASTAITARLVGGALLAVLMASCGLAVSGAGTDNPDLDGSSATSSGSGGQGSSSSGSSSGVSLGPDSASDYDATATGDDGGQPTGDGPALGPGDARADGARGADAGPRDAGGVDAASYCPQLNTCCGLLSAFGVSSTTVTSCLSTAAGGSSGTCLTLLSTFQSFGICY